MAEQWHTVKDNLELTLDEDIGSGDTSFDVGSGQGASCPSVPFWVKVKGKSEQMEVTDVSSDTLTVVRGANGTGASPHYEGDVLELDVIAAQTTEFQTALDDLYAFLAAWAGGGEGVIRDAQTPTYLKVVAQGTPDMTVKVQDGCAFVNGKPVRISADTTSETVTAPTGNPRIDIVQIDHYGTVDIKAGSEAGSPSPPSVDSGYFKLAEIYCRVGMTSIKDTDDSTNGYITDSRVYV